MYNQQQQQQHQQQPFQSTGISQYQGLQKQFQPLGNVQSFYGQTQQSQQAQQWQQQQQQQQQQQYGNYQSSESYHTANYRGNQPGHDQALRSDSFQPTQQQGWGAQSGIQSGGTGYSSYASQPFGLNNAYGAARGGISPASYGQASASTYGQAQAPAYGQAQASTYGQATSSFGQTSSGYGQQHFAQSPESFHTANYRGNQPGHDQSLRSDSFSPSQQQGMGMGTGTGAGMGMQSGFQSGGTDYSSFRYGVRGNEQGLSGQNNANQQFGFNNAY